MRSLSIGLLSDDVKFQLKPYLDDQRVTDYVLIHRMNEAASVESERQSKQRKNTSIKTPKVNKLQTEMLTSQQGQGAAKARVGVQEQSAEVVKPKNRKTPAVASSRDSELYKTVRLLREEMAEIRKSIITPQELTHQVRRSTKRRCKTCQEQGTGDQCKNCFKCGQSGHFSRGCRGQWRLAGKPEVMKVTIQGVAAPKLLPPSQAESDDKVHELLCNRLRQLEAVTD